MMVRSGYNREESSALVASANLVAPIMPPSVPMIVYGVSAGVSINLCSCRHRSRRVT